MCVDQLSGFFAQSAVNVVFKQHLTLFTLHKSLQDTAECAGAFSRILERLMKCGECQMLLGDYVDGALGEKAGELVNAHVSACSACAQFREQLVREQAIYTSYERDVEVTPMLWSSIEAQIKRERAARPVHQIGLLSRLREQMVGMFGAPRLSPALAFALVLAAITVTVIVMTRMNRGGGEVATNNSNVAAPASPDRGANDNSAPAPKAGGENAVNNKGPVVPAPQKVNAVRKAP